MSFDRPRHAAGTVDQPLPSNQRRTFLEVLEQVVHERCPGLKASQLLRAGCPVLFVVNMENISRRTDVGCDFDKDEGWSFTWGAEGRIIGPVEDTHGVVDVIARFLRAPQQGG